MFDLSEAWLKERLQLKNLCASALTRLDADDDAVSGIGRRSGEVLLDHPLADLHRIERHLGFRQRVDEGRFAHVLATQQSADDQIIF